MKKNLDKVFSVFVDTKNKIKLLDESTPEIYVELLFKLNESCRRVIRSFEDLFVLYPDEFEYTVKYSQVWENPKNYIPDIDYIYNIWARI